MVTVKLTQTDLTNMIKLNGQHYFLTIHTIVTMPCLPAALTCWPQNLCFYSAPDKQFPCHVVTSNISGRKYANMSKVHKFYPCFMHIWGKTFTRSFTWRTKHHTTWQRCSEQLAADHYHWMAGGLKKKKKWSNGTSQSQTVDFINELHRFPSVLFLILKKRKKFGQTLGFLYTFKTTARSRGNRVVRWSRSGAIT